MSIWVCGEVLIDLIPVAPGSQERVPHVGGGPANTAKALARFGHEVHFIDGISTDEYGEAARKELLDDEVKLDLALTSDKPTCLAIVSLDAAGGASYEFKIDDTSTFDFDLSWLPDPSRYKPQVLHIGTLATVIEPGESVLYSWAMEVSEFAPVVFDPNIRPSVISDREKYRESVERWVALSTVVKVSDEDVKWLYPEESVDHVAQRWVNDGTMLVVVTRGAEGIDGYTPDGKVSVPGIRVDVVDTVGAGDTVGAIVVEAILENDLFDLRGEKLKAALIRATKAAAITVSRAGAQPPYKHELKNV